MKETNGYLEDDKKTTKPVHHVLQFQWLKENMQITGAVLSKSQFFVLHLNFSFCVSLKYKSTTGQLYRRALS